MRWSRWGRSSYERDEDLAAERASLQPWVELCPPEQDAEVLSVTSKTRVDAGLLDRAPSARLVITTTSGHDHMDLALMRARGIAAARLPEARRDAVVETALAMLLSGLRALGPMQEAARAGRWVRGELPALAPRGLSGARVGVIGLGVIGARMARVLGALDATVLGLDPAGLPEGVRSAGLDELLQTCDAITLHCDLNPSTRGLISADKLAIARPDLVLVNTARGGLLDVRAAVARLGAGQLGALGVDVFPVEPWPDLRAVQEHPRLLLTPHAAGWSLDLLARLRRELAHSVSCFAQGLPVPHRLC